MAIGDLLAEITGEKSSPGVVTPPPPLLPPQKRKAEQDIRKVESKTPRISSNISARSSITPSASRPINGGTRPPLPTKSTFSGTSRPIPAASPPKPKPTTESSSRYSSSSTQKASHAPLRAGTEPASTASQDGPQRAPKKGSFAEIMARGQLAQKVMGRVGQIQHKKVEKIPSKQEREEMKTEARKVARDSIKANRTSTKATIGGKVGTSGVRDRPTPTSGSRNGTVTKEAAKKRPEPEPEKKIRKPAVTTGYSGTARPRPDEKSKQKRGTPGGVLLDRQFSSRYGRSERSRYDEEEEDEDLDDFIEYDDEEEEDIGHRDRRRYYDESDESSDMEAGRDEIDDEEERAEYMARRDDMEEERRERMRKAAKEQRKQQLLEAQRSRR